MSPFITFLIAATILAVTPGPGIAYVIARTVAGGRKEGLASCLGTGVGGSVIQEGRLDQWDVPYKLYHEPNSRFTADFVGAGAFVRGQVRETCAGRRIAIALGELEGRGYRRGGHGQAVDVLLRPDDVIHDDQAPASAVVVRKLFRGAEFLYTLRLDSGEDVLSLVPSHHNHAIGERIGVRLEVDHVVAFPVGQG